MMIFPTEPASIPNSNRRKKPVISHDKSIVIIWTVWNDSNFSSHDERDRGDDKKCSTEVTQTLVEYSLWQDRDRPRPRLTETDRDRDWSRPRPRLIETETETDRDRDRDWPTETETRDWPRPETDRDRDWPRPRSSVSVHVYTEDGKNRKVGLFSSDWCS